MTTTLVTGGVRSGKSRHAEALVGDRPAVYVAPGRPVDDGDPEWAERVRRHRERRPATWTTIESADLAGAIDHGLRELGVPVIVDCLGVWLARVLDESDGWTDPDAGAAAVTRERDRLLAAWDRAGQDPHAELVLVTNEVGLGVVPATVSGRFFRDELGRLNGALSAAAGRVHLVVAGRVLDLSSAPVVNEGPTA